MKPPITTLALCAALATAGCAHQGAAAPNSEPDPAHTGLSEHRKESRMGKARNIADAEERFVNIWDLSCQQND